jgi:UDP-3-O-[3-hydroxymyristoyl] N-acetylglucosamine deacetylase
MYHIAVRSATLIRPVTISGTGLFSGERCRAVIRPARAGAGITFVRGDAAIHAHPDNYLESPNCSILAHEGAQVAQTEHVLAALWAAGIDTAMIELVGPELPSRDGSARPPYDVIATGGRELLGERRKLDLKDPLRVGEPPEPSITIEPAEGLEVVYSFSHPELGDQQFSGGITRDWAVDGLLPARTFITEKEAEEATAAGILQHADETAALLIRDGQPSDPLRFDDEYARHKVLDLLGDLYAVPLELQGKITADRSGHALNRELARQLAALKPAPPEKKPE